MVIKTYEIVEKINKRHSKKFTNWFILRFKDREFFENKSSTISPSELIHIEKELNSLGFEPYGVF